MVERVPLVQEKYREWDQLCFESKDSWFWQTSLWVEFTLALKGTGVEKNLSYLLYENGKPVAGVLLFLEKQNDKRTLGFSGRAPFPFLAPWVSATDRRRILNLVFTDIEGLAQEYGAEGLQLGYPALAAEINLRTNPFLRFGYQDISYTTCILDLQKPEAERLRDLSKGHRSCIKQADVEFQSLIWNHDNITREVFSGYQETHRLDAGRVTRPQRTFDLMFDSIKAGNAVLLEARAAEVSAGYILLHYYKGNAFYSSACRRPEFQEKSLHHLLLWRGMNWLAVQGVRFFEIGLQVFGHEIANVPSRKEVQISHFKREFGGELVRIPVGERFWSPSYGEAVWRDRLDKWLVAYPFSAKL